MDPFLFVNVQRAPKANSEDQLYKIYSKAKVWKGNFNEKKNLAIGLAMLTMATTGTAYAATSFWQPVYYVNVGYDASTIR